jgi:hypothetical protein
MRTFRENNSKEDHVNKMKARIVATIFAVAATGTCVAGTAHAADGASDAAVSTVRLELPMRLGGYDLQQVERAGNRIVRDGDSDVLIDGRTGKEISRVSSGAHTFGTVIGDCGSSYVDISDSRGDRKITFVTGFNLYGPSGGDAFDFSWDVTGTGPVANAYMYWEDSGPQFPGPRWDSGRVSKAIPSGSSGFWFVEANGYAVLTNGGVCYSGRPNDTASVS